MFFVRRSAWYIARRRQFSFPGAKSPQSSAKHLYNIVGRLKAERVPRRRRFFPSPLKTFLTVNSDIQVFGTFYFVPLFARNPRFKCLNIGIKHFRAHFLVNMPAVFQQNSGNFRSKILAFQPSNLVFRFGRIRTLI